MFALYERQRTATLVPRAHCQALTSCVPMPALLRPQVAVAKQTRRTLNASTDTESGVYSLHVPIPLPMLTAWCPLVRLGRPSAAPSATAAEHRGPPQRRLQLRQARHVDAEIWVGPLVPIAPQRKAHAAKHAVVLQPPRTAARPDGLPTPPAAGAPRLWWCLGGRPRRTPDERRGAGWRDPVGTAVRVQGPHAAPRRLEYHPWRE